MTHVDLATQTAIESSLLTTLMEGLRNTIAWKVHDADFIRKLSTLRFLSQCFQRHLERVLALEEYDGYMDLVLQESPRLSATIETMRQDHDLFRKEARQIVHRFENVASIDDALFGLACDDLVGLLNRLHAHNKKEAKLMQMAFGQDEGGGEG